MDLFIGLAILGGIIGGFSFNEKQKQQYAEADAQRAELEQQQKELEKVYEAKKKEDLDLADFKDSQVTKNEQNLSEDTKNALESLGLQEQANAVQIQNQQISNSSDTGSALANAATSGIRSGSVMESIERSDAYAAGLLEANREALSQQTELSYRQAQLGLAQNMDSITSDRYSNNSTRKSYSAGGYEYEKFKASYDKMSRSINDLRTDVKGNAFDRNKLNFWDGLTAIFTGGASLVNLGSSYKNLKDSN